jgi:hypothetical protein
MMNDIESQRFFKIELIERKLIQKYNKLFFKKFIFYGLLYLILPIVCTVMWTHLDHSGNLLISLFFNLIFNILLFFVTHLILAPFLESDMFNKNNIKSYLNIFFSFNELISRYQLETNEEINNYIQNIKVTNGKKIIVKMNNIKNTTNNILDELNRQKAELTNSQSRPLSVKSIDFDYINLNPNFVISIMLVIILFTAPLTIYNDQTIGWLSSEQVTDVEKAHIIELLKDSTDTEFKARVSKMASDDRITYNEYNEIKDYFIVSKGKKKANVSDMDKIKELSKVDQVEDL